MFELLKFKTKSRKFCYADSGIRDLRVCPWGKEITTLEDELHHGQVLLNHEVKKSENLL